MHKPMGWGNGRHGRECKRGRVAASGRIARGEKEGRGVRTTNNANSREGSSVVLSEQRGVISPNLHPLEENFSLLDRQNKMNRFVA